MGGMSQAQRAEWTEDRAQAAFEAVELAMDVVRTQEQTR